MVFVEVADAAEFSEVCQCLIGWRSCEQACPGHEHPRFILDLRCFEILHAGQDLNCLPVVLRDEVEGPRQGQLQGGFEGVCRLRVF